MRHLVPSVSPTLASLISLFYLSVLVCFLTSLQTFFFYFPGGSSGKESACKVGDLDLIPGFRRSPGKGHSYQLQYSGLEKVTMSDFHHKYFNLQLLFLLTIFTILYYFPFFELKYLDDNSKQHFLNHSIQMLSLKFPS